MSSACQHDILHETGAIQGSSSMVVEKGGERDGVAEGKETRTMCLKKFVAARKFVVPQGLRLRVPS